MTNKTPVKIEKGIPIPATRIPHSAYAAMEVGDSVLVPDISRTRAVTYYGATHGWKTAQRTVEGGVRVWRVA